jgi:hypothetical protein
MSKENNEGGSNMGWVWLGLIAIGIFFGIGPFGKAKCSSDKPETNTIYTQPTQSKDPSFTGSGEEYCDGSMCWCTKFKKKGVGTPNYSECGHPKNWHHNR